MGSDPPVLYKTVRIMYDGWQGNAPVGEWGNDEPAGVAEVLVAVLELRVGLLGDAVVDVAVPVEAQLLEPLEGPGVRAARLGQVLDDVARVHLDRHQRHDLQTLVLGQVCPDRLREFVQHEHLTHHVDRQAACCTIHS